MGFYVTAIQNVTNIRDSSIMFINTEHSGNNRQIDNRSTVSVGNCWIPWCFRERDFPAHHLEIIDASSDAVLWYIWQQDKPERVICASHTGYEQPGPRISGEFKIEESYNLFVGPGDNDLRENKESG